MIYSYNESQRDALFLKFILVKNSACFGQMYCHHPEFQHCVHSNRYLSYCLLAWSGPDHASSQHN